MGSPLRSPPLDHTRRTTNSEATLISASEPVCSAAGGVEAENDEEGSLTMQLDAPTREQKSKIQRMAL
jgi:hypothetical protein